MQVPATFTRVESEGSRSPILGIETPTITRLETPPWTRALLAAMLHLFSSGDSPTPVVGQELIRINSDYCMPVNATSRSTVNGLTQSSTIGNTDTLAIPSSPFLTLAPSRLSRCYSTLSCLPPTLSRWTKGLHSRGANEVVPRARLVGPRRGNSTRHATGIMPTESSPSWMVPL